jgi:pantetheine-phosphate adenylyltransferase
MRTCIYPGSFDPPTNGHINILQRALTLFDRVVVAVAVNVQKAPLFTFEERKHMLRETLKDDRLEVDSFSGLLVDYAQKRGAVAVVRGLRAISDFEYEFQMAHMNRKLAPALEHVFLMTDEANFYVSSRLIREVASFGGSVTQHVPPVVLEALRAKYPALAARG